MRSMILHKIQCGFDRARNGLVFQLMLESGEACEVVFPIGHVSLEFGRELTALGYIETAMMGHIETVDGFLGYVESLGGPLETDPIELNGSVFDRAKSMQRELAALAQSGKATPADINKRAAELKAGLFTRGPLDKVGGAIKTVGKVALDNTVGKVAKTAVSVARAGVNIAQGQNVLKSVGGVLKTAASDLKMVGQYAGNIPGIGTGIGALASGANAALNGKSLTEIAKATAVGAMPGGPLAQAAASAALNLTQAGVEGKNLVKAAAGELVNAAVSMAPAATQGLLRQTAQAALAGQNVLSAAGRSTLNIALAQVADPNARALLSHLASGAATPTSLVNAAGGELAGDAISRSGAGAVARMMNQAATLAPATPHFIAISAKGLAAAAAAQSAARLASSPPTPVNVQNLARLRNNVASMAQSRNPQAGLIFAALKSAPMRAA